jgi:hypothetical protein
MVQQELQELLADRVLLELLGWLEIKEAPEQRE